MNQRLKNVLKFLLFLSIGVFLIWLSIHKLSEKDVQDIGNALRRADYRWLILSMAAGVLSHISRAMRWNMLMEPLGFKPKLSNSFFAVMVGYLANYAFPKLGEVTRPSILTRYEKVPFSESFGTVIVERLVDVFTFLVVAVIVFLIQFDVIYKYLSANFFPKVADLLMSKKEMIYITAACALVLIAAFIALRKKIMSRLGSGVRNFIYKFVEGLNSIRKVKSPTLFIAHSVFIWLVYYVTFHICLFCLPETQHISISTGLTIFFVGTITIIVTPGGLGAYPIAVASVLSIYSINFSIGTAFGWFVWLSQFVSILILGLISLILLPLTNKQSQAT